MINFPIGTVTKQFLGFVTENITPISTGAVIIGIISSVVLAVRAGKQSADDIQEIQEEYDEELTTSDVIRATWKNFIPVVLVMVLTISCLVVSTNRMLKKYAALSTAYALSESYLRDYMAAAKDTVGGKKEQQIRDKTIERQVTRNPVSERGIIETGHGDTLFYEAILTRYFRSSFDYVKNCETNLNGIYQSEHSLKFNEYTYALGLGACSEEGDHLGWRQSGNIDGTEKFEILYSSGLEPNTGEPYVALYHVNRLTELY